MHGRPSARDSTACRARSSSSVSVNLRNSVRRRWLRRSLRQDDDYTRGRIVLHVRSAHRLVGVGEMSQGVLGNIETLGKVHDATHERSAKLLEELSFIIPNIQAGMCSGGTRPTKRTLRSEMSLASCRNCSR